ncbi:MAG: hypothetical protein IPN29_19080 [Saprospiraceae bacterium]|nr:hypothetical protein [Saprospiraceae bacterium]
MLDKFDISLLQNNKSFFSQFVSILVPIAGISIWFLPLGQHPKEGKTKGIEFMTVKESVVDIIQPSGQRPMDNLYI